VVRSPLANEKYLHWDRLGYYEPPGGLTHEEWWYALKLRRESARVEIPLTDKEGVHFSFTQVGELLEFVSTIDRQFGGSVPLPEGLGRSDLRSYYIDRTRIEEAYTSSQLEGAATTRAAAREIILLGRPPRNRGERMVLNNYHTMEYIRSIRDEPLTRENLFSLHRMVTDEARDDASAAGRLRRPEESVVIGPAYEETIYHVPPDSSELSHRLDQMIAFANGETPGGFVHPVIRAMILHFWLAYDHPFVDGNGRSARALFYWSMLRHGYWLFEFLSISHVILKGAMRYQEAYLFTETDANDLTYFLLYHADIVRRAMSEMLAEVVKEGEDRRQALDDYAALDSLNERQRQVVLHAVRRPGSRYTVESHRASQGVVTQTARTDLQGLVERGLMRMVKIGRAFHFIPVENLEEKLRG